MLSFKSKKHLHTINLENILHESKYMKLPLNLFYYYFAAHCCSFEISFSSLKKSVISMFSIAFDLCLIYIILSPWVNLNLLPGLTFRKVAAENCIQLCALSYRILIHTRGKELLNIICRVRKLESMKDNRRYRIIKRKTIFLLILHVIYYSAMNIECLRTSHPAEKLYLSKMYNLPTEDPNWVFVAGTSYYLLLIWFVTSLPSLFAIYFYFLCSLLKESLKNFEDEMNQDMEMNRSRILLKYKILTGTIFKVRRRLHTILFFVSCHVLFNSFYGIYLSMFDVNAIRDKAGQAIIVLLGSFVIFSMMCVSSSRINHSYQSMKYAFYQYLSNNEEFENSLRALKLCENDTMEFVLLDAIFINKSLIIKAFGTMFTYGIMISTLGRTTSNIQSVKN